MVFKSVSRLLGKYVKVLYQKPWEDICQGSKKHIEKSPGCGDETRAVLCARQGGAEALEGQSELGGRWETEMTQVRNAISHRQCELVHPSSQAVYTPPGRPCTRFLKLRHPRPSAWGPKFLLQQEAVSGLWEEDCVGFWVPLSRHDWTG